MYDNLLTRKDLDELDQFEKEDFNKIAYETLDKLIELEYNFSLLNLSNSFSTLLNKVKKYINISEQ